MPLAFARVNSSLFSGAFTPHCNTPCRSPLPEPDTPEEKKATDIVYTSADLRAGEALSSTEIPGIRRTGGSCQVPQDDRRASQNMVPEQKNEMEVKNKTKTKILMICKQLSRNILKYRILHVLKPTYALLMCSNRVIAL